MRAACISFACIFGFFSYLQLNDLEQYGTEVWLGWVLLYGAVALASLASAWKPLPRSLYSGGAGLAILLAAIRAAAIEWDEPLLYNETNPAGNETGGLLIVALWLAFLAMRERWSGGAAKEVDQDGSTDDAKRSEGSRS